jgi:Na+/melibiose symporter-like transporter
MIGRPQALAAFGTRSFRFQWPADLATSLAFEMEILILGWYILVETGSVVKLTLYGALVFTGTFCAPMYGVIGDRIGHRVVMTGMRCVYALLAAIILLLAHAGRLDPDVVLVIAAVVGFVRPADQGMRSALVAETMPSELLPAAIGVSRTTSDMARVFGALTGASLFVALGMAPAYVVVTGLYLVGVVLTFFTGARTTATPAGAASAALTRTSPWRDLHEGLLYVWQRPHLLAAMWLAFLVNLTAFPLSGGLLPYVARSVYKVDQTGLSYLAASFAGGALIGSMAVGTLGMRFGMARLMLAASAIWYAALLVFAMSTTAPVGLVALLTAGFFQSLSMVSLAIILLRTSEARFRGRIMGVRMLAIYSLPLGLLVAGALVERIGFHLTAGLYSVFGLIVTLLIALYWRAALIPATAAANAR